MGQSQSPGILYHGSKLAGLRTLKPRVSSHGKAFVYASDNPLIALFFLGNWNDFMLNLAYGDDSTLELTERFPGAVRQVFEGATGFLYTVPGDTFTSGETRFEGERVSRQTVPVIGCQKIDSVYENLLMADGKSLRIIPYPQRHPDIPADDSDLVKDAIILHEKGHQEIISICLTYHPQLREKFIQAGYVV